MKSRKRQHSQECKDSRRHCFCDLTFDLLTFEINGFPGLVVEHLYGKFGDFNCIGVWDIVQKNRQTIGGENHTPATAIGVGNKVEACFYAKAKI